MAITTTPTTPNRRRASKVPKSTERVTASDIESDDDDDDQQHTNGASDPVKALDGDADGVPLSDTVIGAQRQRWSGEKRIVERFVYGPRPFSLSQWQHELRYEDDRVSSRSLLSHMPFSLLTLLSL